MSYCLNHFVLTFYPVASNEKKALYRYAGELVSGCRNLVCRQKSKDIVVINNDKLKGKIIIGYCRQYETFIFIIKVEGCKDQYKRLVPRKFSFKPAY